MFEAAAYEAEAELGGGTRIRMRGTWDECVEWTEKVQREHGRETPVSIRELEEKWSRGDEDDV